MKEPNESIELDPPPNLKIELKQCKHEFSAEEQNQIGGDLARAFAGLRGVENEFDQVKASYKARQTEAEARIDNLSTARMNGFEMRQKKCVVIYKPQERKKLFICEEDYQEFGEEAHPALIEEMTQADFQADLLQADSRFSSLCEIELFKPTDQDRGLIIVGYLGKLWYAAVRANVGKNRIEERLDSEQPAAKKRFDAITQAGKRYFKWIEATLGKDNAKGFKELLDKAIETQKERAE